ncbi:MAG: hypothetical protein AAGF12_31770, partial [Myxococcota bacterium]
MTEMSSIPFLRALSRPLLQSPPPLRGFLGRGGRSDRGSRLDPQVAVLERLEPFVAPQRSYELAPEQARINLERGIALVDRPGPRCTIEDHRIDLPDRHLSVRIYRPRGAAAG